MKLIEKINCEIEELIIPNVYKKYGFITEDEITFTNVVVNYNKEKINVFVNRNELVGNLVPGNDVVLEKYETENNYDEYLNELYKQVYTKFSEYSDEVKDATYKKYEINEIEFEKNPKKLIVYKLEGYELTKENL